MGEMKKWPRDDSLEALFARIIYRYSRMNINKDDLVFERADAEKITAHFRNVSQACAKPLSQKAYLTVEKKLSVAEVNVGRTAYWILYFRHDPEKIICSCTTYLREMVVTGDYGPSTRKAVVVTDLFTLPKYRSQGMAKTLLENLCNHIDKLKPGRSIATVVYAEPNSPLFEGLGWKPFDATQLRISLGQWKKTHHTKMEHIETLHYHDVMKLIPKDVNVCCHRLAGKYYPTTHLQFLPTDASTRWHLIRAKLLSLEINSYDSRVELYGAEYFDGGQHARIWWLHDYRKGQLNIARLFTRIPKGGEFSIAPLLHAAMTEASICGLSEVVFWDPSEQVVNAANRLAEELGKGVTAVVEQRIDNVPHLRWHKGYERETVWQEKEYFGRCY